MKVLVVLFLTQVTVLVHVLPGSRTLEAAEVAQLRSSTAKAIKPPRDWLISDSLFDGLNFFGVCEVNADGVLENVKIGFFKLFFYLIFHRDRLGECPVAADPCDVPCTSTFDSKTDLDTAVAAWTTDMPTAMATYGDINHWCFGSGMTTLQSLFYGEDTFNSDISCWDVSGITNMRNLFREAFAFNQNLNSWDVSNVVIMTSMFEEADSFNLPLDAWDVSDVEFMDFMFFKNDVFNQDISGWDVSSVTTFEGMFEEATGIDQTLSAWLPAMLANCAATSCPEVNNMFDSSVSGCTVDRPDLGASDPSTIVVCKPKSESLVVC